MCCHQYGEPIMYKADIIKVLWNKKCYKDARRQKKYIKKMKEKNKAYLSGKSGKASWGKMEEMIFK